MPSNKIPYVTSVRKRDDSYPSTSNRQRFSKVYVKESWMVEGEDREAAFVFALRKLYATIKFPEVEMYKLSFESGEREVVGKTTMTGSLIGLAQYGARIHFRDPKTFQVVVAEMVENPETRRILTQQVVHDGGTTIFDAKGPLQLCRGLGDAMFGLLNAFRLGYVHREISPDCIFLYSRFESGPGFMLSKDAKSVEGKPRQFNGFIWDFSICQNINGEDGRYSGDIELMDILPTTPTCLMATEKHSDVLHSPIYDLDSFFWLLLWAASDIICDYMSGKRKVKLDNPHFLAVQAKKDKSASSEFKHSSIAAGATASGVTTADPGQSAKTLHSISGTSEGATLGEAVGHTRSEISEDAAMDVDTEKGDEDKEKIYDEDHKMDEDKERSGLHNDEEKKRKREESTDSEERRKIKGKQKLVVSDEDLHSRENCDEPKSEPSSNTWYFHELGPGHLIHIMKPSDHPAPDGFKRPDKAQYVAFEDDKMAYVIHALIEPRSDHWRKGNQVTRMHLLSMLDEFLADSPGLAPFRPLAQALRDLEIEYFTRPEDLKTRTFSRDEVELAFERYIDAFRKYMPMEDDWYYLKWYEGPDTLCKFDKNKFLGSFASPTNYEASKTCPNLPF